MSISKSPDTKRKVADEPEDPKKKVTVSHAEYPFTIVHAFDFGDHVIVSHAHSHEEAQRKVDALHIELAIWIASGGDDHSRILPDSMYYFYCETKAPHFVYKHYHTTGISQREVYREDHRTEKVEPWYTSDPDKIGKDVVFDKFDKTKEEGDFSLANDLALTEDIKALKAFWHGIRTLPWSVLTTLKLIHPKHYTNIKHENSFKEDKEDVEDS